MGITQITKVFKWKAAPTPTKDEAKRENGFSLLEILMSIAMIPIMVAVAIPNPGQKKQYAYAAKVAGFMFNAATGMTCGLLERVQPGVSTAWTAGDDATAVASCISVIGNNPYIATDDKGNNRGTYAITNNGGTAADVVVFQAASSDNATTAVTDDKLPYVHVAIKTNITPWAAEAVYNYKTGDAVALASSPTIGSTYFTWTPAASSAMRHVTISE